VSDDNRTRTDVPRKFREAALKIGAFYRDKPMTSAVRELIEKAEDPNGYPGLGYIKKLSVLNHLELIYSL
jgi:hypothetical protein